MAWAMHRRPRRNILNREVTIEREMRLMAEEQVDSPEELTMPQVGLTDADRRELDAVIRADLMRFDDEEYDRFGEPTERELDAYERAVSGEY